MPLLTAKGSSEIPQQRHSTMCMLRYSTYNPSFPIFFSKLQIETPCTPIVFIFEKNLTLDRNDAWRVEEYDWRFSSAHIFPRQISKKEDTVLRIVLDDIQIGQSCESWFFKCWKMARILRNIFAVRAGQHFVIRDKFLFKTVFQ